VLTGVFQGGDGLLVAPLKNLFSASRALAGPPFPALDYFEKGTRSCGISAGHECSLHLLPMRGYTKPRTKILSTMPELPEVETIRQDLRKKIIGKKIKNFETLYPKVAAGKPNETAVFLVGKTIAEIDRRGKLMIVRFKKNDEVLLVHLKMTGQLIYVFKKTIIGGGHSFKTLNTQLPDKYTGAIFTFSDGSKLFFNDLRKFGYLKLADTAQLKKVLAGFSTYAFRWIQQFIYRAIADYDDVIRLPVHMQELLRKSRKALERAMQDEDLAPQIDQNLIWYGISPVSLDKESAAISSTRNSFAPGKPFTYAL
jgi:hypothetical protein